MYHKNVALFDRSYGENVHVLRVCVRENQANMKNSSVCKS